MDFTVGEVFEGTVTGITKFGAFVSLSEGKSGMVHISEVANTYVKDIREHLTENQSVKVKIIKIDDEGRINLSIKKAEEAPKYQRKRVIKAVVEEEKTPEAAFEDKIKMFLKDSENRMADIKHNFDKKSGNRRRK